MSRGRDFVLWEIEFAEYAVERLRENVAALHGPGRWGGSRDDLLSTSEVEAMRPVRWWKK
ncbi:MAG: hypothetical protein ACOYXM_01695 [Actinomycetota bacterium]